MRTPKVTGVARSRHVTVESPLIGTRIKALREQRELTQDSVARLFGFKDRQTVSAIETGDRGVTAEELLLAVEKLGAPLEYFTDPFLLAGEGRFSWRHTGVDAQRLAAYEHNSGRWIAAFKSLAPAVGRETPFMRRALGLTRRSRFEDAVRAGERFAVEFVLGDAPATRLSQSMERQLGILVLMVDAERDISGAACRLPELDAVLIARREVAGRRHFDLAHELFHILTWDAMPPEHSEAAQETGGNRVGQLANNFAAAVLMPYHPGVVRVGSWRSAASLSAGSTSLSFEAHSRSRMRQQYLESGVPMSRSRSIMKPVEKRLMSDIAAVERIRIRGFRSLADIEIRDLPQVAVLIGANGSGKSNLMRFFEMTSWMLWSGRLAEYGVIDPAPDWIHVGSGHTEANILETARSAGPDGHTAGDVLVLLRRCEVYQFHDTSDDSRFKKRWDVDDNAELRAHGGNLAAVLHGIERDDRRRYELICHHIGRVLPVFDRFDIQESYGRVLLRWKAKGTDKTFGPHLTSDGSLRLFALVTLLNLPDDMLPDVLLLDEPELGLHPAAIGLIAGMIKQVAVDRQVIVASQSPQFVDAFDLDEIVVMDLRDGRTVCRTLDPDDYQVWLDEYAPGQLWEKNLLGGRP